jgi:hypothetical protein
MLEDFGHTVIDAISGAAALEVIRKTPHVDLVITGPGHAANDRHAARRCD